MKRERANRVCQHLEGKPQFRYNPHGGALELSFTGRHRISGTIETATRTVVVNRTTGMLSTLPAGVRLNPTGKKVRPWHGWDVPLYHEAKL